MLLVLLDRWTGELRPNFVLLNGATKGQLFNDLCVMVSLNIAVNCGLSNIFFLSFCRKVRTISPLRFRPLYRFQWWSRLTKMVLSRARILSLLKKKIYAFLDSKKLFYFQFKVFSLKVISLAVILFHNVIFARFIIKTQGSSVGMRDRHERAH